MDRSLWNLMPYAPMRRSWYQFGFSLRDLWWITLAVAIFLGWWVDRSRFVTDLRSLEKHFTKYYYDANNPARFELRVNRDLPPPKLRQKAGRGEAP